MHGDLPVLALLGDVVELDPVAGHPHVPLLQRRGAVVVIELGVPLAADPEQPEVDQPDDASGHPVAVEVTSLQVGLGGGAQAGQRAGEAQDMGELLHVPLLAPQLVVAVLGPAPAVHPGRLDVAERIR